MFKPSNLTSNNLEFLVRTALSNGEISPGMTAEIARYRSTVHLSAEDQRYLAILEDAIADGCIRPVGALSNAASGTARVNA
ncbi:MAG: hypothetical protein AAFV72_20930 [Cyanobacteria bacterium J06635_1]